MRVRRKWPAAKGLGCGDGVDDAIVFEEYDEARIVPARDRWFTNGGLLQGRGTKARFDGRHTRATSRSQMRTRSRQIDTIDE